MTRTATDTAHKHIRRYTAANRPGWRVRISRTVAPKSPAAKTVAVSQTFVDVQYGGKQAALAAAIGWRDEQLLLLGPKLPTGHGTHRSEPGFSYMKKLLRGPAERQYLAWYGCLRVESGRRLTTHRSIEVHGERDAEGQVSAWLRNERRALAARLRQQGQRACLPPLSQAG